MNNIFLLLTFADHKRPEALIKGVEKETGIKFASTCKFNNCALYENNEANSDPFTKSYWDIGATSMETFFTTLVRNVTLKALIFHLKKTKNEQPVKLQYYHVNTFYTRTVPKFGGSA